MSAEQINTLLDKQQQLVNGNDELLKLCSKLKPEDQLIYLPQIQKLIKQIPDVS